MFLATASDDILLHTICEILSSNDTQLKTISILDNLGLNVDIQTDIINGLKALLPSYLELNTTTIQSEQDVELKAQTTTHIAAAPNDLIKFDVLIQILVQRLSHININEHIVSIIDAYFNVDPAISVANPVNINSIVNEQFNIDAGIAMTEFVNIIAQFAEQFNIAEAITVANPIDIMAIIKEQFNIDQVINILSNIPINCLFNNTVQQALTSNMFSEEDIKAITTITLNSSYILYIVEQYIINGVGSMALETPIVLDIQFINDLISIGLLLQLKQCAPEHILVNQQNMIVGKLKPTIKIPLRLLATDMIQSNITNITNTKAISYITANIIAQTKVGAQLTKETTWEYPIWLTKNNLKITQAKNISYNNNNLEVE